MDKHGISYQSKSTEIDVVGAVDTKLTVQYTGCGGLFLSRAGSAIMIDPFFSHQGVMRIGASILGGGSAGKRKLVADPKMVEFGLKSIEACVGTSPLKVNAILSAHSHYDHLMDVPAVYEKLRNEPKVYLNRSGFNTCYNVIDTADMIVLENHMTTREISRPPIELRTMNGKVHIYPILSDHNPHIKNIKFFSGGMTRPATQFTMPYAKTRANDWLEGNTFSFLIDYLDAQGSIELRIFIQSSSCSPPAGIPPAALLNSKPVDVAFLGLVSYQFSPDYPCTLLNAIRPEKVVWIHWEDFFRRYTKKPKTVRGTDVVKFFGIPCVSDYKSKAFLPLPGTRLDIR